MEQLPKVAQRGLHACVGFLGHGELMGFFDLLHQCRVFLLRDQALLQCRIERFLTAREAVRLKLLLRHQAFLQRLQLALDRVTTAATAAPCHWVVVGVKVWPAIDKRACTCWRGFGRIAASANLAIYHAAICNLHLRQNCGVFSSVQCCLRQLPSDSAAHGILGNHRIHLGGKLLRSSFCRCGFSDDLARFNDN